MTTPPRAVAALALLVLAASCGHRDEPARRLRLATTTSTENSGLLEVLLPPFEEEHGIRVDVIAVGTGKALRLAENGDVDAVLVHAPEREERFVAAGHGVDRRRVMHNDFVILGPSSDPAKVAAAGGDAAKALAAIAAAGAPFVSRGDDSGTHIKERSLWRAAGIEPQGEGYMEAGQGMGATLTIADEKRAYTLADRGTFVAFRGHIDLVALCQGDPRLHNPYSIIAVNPQRHPSVDYAAATKLADFLVSPRGQRLIAGYRRDGEQLFVPHARAP
ncbi:MAG: substrate-binding domain-containing protein [Candidatus Brocadiia bacterium]